MATPDIAVSVVVDRTALTLAALELDDDEVKFSIIEWGPGSRTFRRSTVEGPFQAGRRLLGAVLDVRSISGAVRVYGASWTEVRTNAEEMFAALSQRSFLITETIDSAVSQYICEPADIAFVGGDTYQKHHIIRKMQEYVLSIPFDPLGSP